jgi:hypothetical protein
MAKTKPALYVIFTGPQKQGVYGACYIAVDGYSTILRSKAARFHSIAVAKEFAEVSRIELNGHAYIGLADFTAV